jgi:hypothetical protein
MTRIDYNLTKSLNVERDSVTELGLRLPIVLEFQAIDLRLVTDLSHLVPIGASDCLRPLCALSIGSQRRLARIPAMKAIASSVTGPTCCIALPTP